MAESSSVPVGARNALSGLSGLSLSGVNGRSATAVHKPMDCWLGRSGKKQPGYSPH